MDEEDNEDALANWSQRFAGQWLYHTSILSNSHHPKQ